MQEEYVAELFATMAKLQREQRIEFLERLKLILAQGTPPQPGSRSSDPPARDLP